MCVVQNPKNVQVKEELTRLRRRLKAAERELQEKRTQSEQRADKITKLKDDLEQITAGVMPPGFYCGLWVDVSPAASCTSLQTVNQYC
jgi:regulator of replication initiation timing